MCVYFLRNVPTMPLTFEEFNELWLDINQVLLQDQVVSKSIVSAGKQINCQVTNDFFQTSKV